jgi:hypothetical protein
MLIRIQNDLYGIDSRLKEIDGGYYIMYDTAKRRYQIHNSNQAGNSYCLTLPYDELDARAVTYVKSTRREYIDNILNEMERNNEKLSDK